MTHEMSPLHKKRLQYHPPSPYILRDITNVHFEKSFSNLAIHKKIKKLFPQTSDLPTFRLVEGPSKNVVSRQLKIGAVFSGGQAAGGHNVIVALCDTGAKVIGFLNGPKGIVENNWVELGKEKVALYRNQGGFDLIGSGREKIETEDQLRASLKTALDHGLDGLIVIGGDDSNTNAAVLAEYFLANGCKTCVIGIPKTIDGDLRSQDIEISFGFDSACKTYSEMIGNIARDALSAKKYYHFIKLMGRSASHITLECALATQPNLALIGEEGKGLFEIVEEISDLMCRRYDQGKEYGVILIPEGLVEFMPEMRDLMKNPNSDQNKSFLQSLPDRIQKQMSMEKDPHGNIQVSKIETEVLLMDLVKKELKKRGFKGKVNIQEHFFGYEGRSCMPSNFDANYCYVLGTLASLAVRDGLTGVICSVQNMKSEVFTWQLKCVPITQLMHVEIRLGKEKPVIAKALVDMKGSPFVKFSHIRKSWQLQDQYRYPGPIQFFGDYELTESVPITLMG